MSRARASLLFWCVTLVAAIAAALGTWHLTRPAADSRPRASQAVQGVSLAPNARRDGLTALDGIGESGYTLGRSSAPVTLVEFADLQCPACRQFVLGVGSQIIERYVTAGKVRLELRILGFIGPDSVTAARMAAAAAVQNRLWPFVELFYQNSGSENSGYVTTGFLEQLAKAVPGLNVSRAMAYRLTPSAAEPLDHAARAARRAHVTDTPAFLIGPTDGPLRILDPSTIASITPFQTAIADVARHQPVPAPRDSRSPAGTCSQASLSCPAG